MLDDRTAQMFLRLAQNEPDLRAWLEGELAAVTQILTNHLDEVHVRRAQGQAQHITRILTLLDPNPARRRGQPT